MGQIVNVVRNEESLQGFQIETSADMHTVLDWGRTRGYWGSINLDSQGNWALGLVSNVTSQSGQVGDWVILRNDVQATIVPEAMAGSLYTVT